MPMIPPTIPITAPIPTLAPSASRRSCRTPGRTLRRFSRLLQRPVERRAVQELGPVGAALLDERGQRTPPPLLAEPARTLGIARERDDRVPERRDLGRRDENAGLAVADRVAEAADPGRGPGAR